MAQRVVMLVDGFNLYHGVRHAFRHRYLWLDVQAVAERLLRPGQELARVYYFTARVRDDPPAERRQDAYMSALATRDKIELLEGRFQAKSHTCRSCQTSWATYEEKESDVNLAVKLVALAARGEYDTALLVSGDSDLCPAVRTARELAPDRRLVAVFPPKRHSAELKRTVDASLRLGEAIIRQSQLPNELVSAAGIKLQRPAKWA